MKFDLKYIPLAFFSLFLGKLMLRGASYTDVITLAILAAFTAFYEIKTKPGQLKALEDKALKLEKDLEDIKTHVQGIKLARDIRTTKMG